MKKYFAAAISAVLMLLGTQAHAQFSLGANWVHAFEISQPGSENAATFNMDGFRVGFAYNISLGDDSVFGIQPGLNLVMLFGGATGADSYSFTLHDPLQPHYTEMLVNLPVNLTVGYALDPDFNLFFYAGPVAQYGALSTSRITGQGNITLKGTGNDYLIDGGYSLNRYKGDTVNNVGADRSQFNVLLGGGFGIQAGDNLEFLVGYEHSLISYSLNGANKVVRHYVTAGLGVKF